MAAHKIRWNKTKRERSLERVLIRLVKRRRGRAYKFSSPGKRSVPDRLVVLPGKPAKIYFIELKRKGKKLTPAQGEERARLKALGAEAYAVDNEEDVELILSGLGHLANEVAVGRASSSKARKRFPRLRYAVG